MKLMLFRIFGWLFLEHSDVKFESCGLVVNPKYPLMGASPDGFVLLYVLAMDSLVDVKCPYNCSKQLCAELEGNKSFSTNENFPIR